MRTYLVLADLASRTEPLDPNDVKPGWVALGIVVLLCIATFFLAKSFLRHSKKAMKPWEGEDADPVVKRTSPHDRG